MDELSELERRMRERVSAAEYRRQSHRQKLFEEMAVLERRTNRFNEQGSRVLEAVLRPRLEKLASIFPNAAILPAEPAHPHEVVCSFQRTDSFPATTKLTLGVGPDHELKNLIATYAVEILPVFFQFERADQKAFSLDGLDNKAVAAWFDEKLIHFIEIYLQIEDVDQYQQDNMVIDPVCGMRLNKALAACQTEHGGRIYYFCVEECLERFAADPNRYLTSVLR